MSDHKTALMQLAFKIQTESYLINPRLLEDATYPCWDFVLHSLCGSRTHLWPAPQWRLYVSHLDYASNDGNQTISDKNALEVITDFAILMPIFEWQELEEGSQSAFSGFPSILDAVDGTVEWDYHNWIALMDKARLTRLFVPGLAELKRPVTRNAEDIEQYCTELQSHVEAAQDQVEQQALCLFCSPKYAEQDRIILIAGAAEWWSFVILSRKHMEGKYCEFDIDAYINLIESSDLRLSVIRGDLADDPQTVPLKKVKTTAASQRRSVTAEDRTERKKARDTLQTAYHAFLKSTSAPFKDEDFETFCRLVGGPNNPTKNVKLSSFKVIFDEDPEPFETYVNNKWSPLMRLGTRASNARMRTIQELLDTAVRDEMF